MLQLLLPMEGVVKAPVPSSYEGEGTFATPSYEGEGAVVASSL